MSPSLQTMGFFMSDINFCNTKEQLNHLGEVVTGKVDGSPTGADIDTSTLPYTGQVRKTLPALEGEYEQSITNKEIEADAAIDTYRLLNKGPYASGITLESKFEYITYNGESYFAVNPPYTTTATTPDADGNLFAGGYLTSQQLSLYTDIVYKASGGNSAVENMISGNPIASGVGMIVECEFGTRFKRVLTTNGDITDFESVGDIYIRDWLSLDEGTAYASARDFANTQNKPLNMMNGYTWDLSSLTEPVALPDYGVEGNFVANVDFTSTRKRERRIQSNGVMDIEATGNTITLSGGHYNTYENVIATAINIDGNASDYGFFWNSFSRSTGLISIDTGNGQSINQNFFHDHRGGIHIFGGDGSTQLEECDQNAFFGLDTTGYEIGVDGWHVLNESYRNQNNIIYHAYMEGAGNKAIKGNFHTMRTYSDGSGSAYATPPTCHHLLQGDENVRNSNDHFSANPQANMAIGGLWDVLNADQDGQPLCFFETNVVQSVVQDNNIPMGFKYKYGGTSNIDFSSLRVRLSNSFSGRFGITVLMQNVQGLLSLEVDNDGGPQTQSANIYHDLGGGFRLYRFSCNARNDGEDDQFRFFFRPLGGTAENYLVAAWATPQKTTFMPGPVPEQHIIGVSYSGGTPNSPAALPVGGRVQNRDASLTNGDTLEWVKITNGTLVSAVTI